jgi:hypothetical protein
VAALFLSAAAAHASMRWATLEAIHQLENPNDRTTPGRFGELGAYQFREMTWRMHTSAPFSRALDRSTSDDIAVRHYEWIKRGLEQAGITPTPYRIALAWNGGLDAAVRDSAPAAAYAYAERAANLASQFDRGASPAATPAAAVPPTPVIQPTVEPVAEPMIIPPPRSFPTQRFVIATN